MNTNIPVKIMRVDDFTELAKITLRSEPDYANELDALIKQAFVDRRTVYYIGKYEKETAQLLERKHFDKDSPDCVFEGFEESADDQIFHAELKVWIRKKNGRWLLSVGSGMGVLVDTIEDIIRAISKYNETATQKINLKFTENFIKRIVG